MAKFSELREIREALNLNQQEMGGLLGVKQSAYQRWETSPSSAAGRVGLEKALGIYRKRTGRDWKPQDATSAGQVPYVTREEMAELRGALKAHVEYWRNGEGKVLQRLEELAQRIEAIERRVSS